MSIENSLADDDANLSGEPDVLDVVGGLRQILPGDGVAVVRQQVFDHRGNVEQGLTKPPLFDYLARKAALFQRAVQLRIVDPGLGLIGFQKLKGDAAARDVAPCATAAACRPV